MEKGGKGFTLSGKGAKSSLKSTQKSLGGKDDNSTKSKKGRKVNFDIGGAPDLNFNLSSKSDGKAGSLFGKGGKGGKGDKASGGKEAKESGPPELRIEQELPKNAKCMMDCEAAYILEGIQDQMVGLSADPSIKIPVSFDKGLQYAKSGSHYTNPQSVRRVLDSLSRHGVSDGEICVIANVCPETEDEVFTLVPSLKAKRSMLSGPIKDVINELSNLKKSEMKPGK